MICGARYIFLIPNDTEICHRVFCEQMFGADGWSITSGFPDHTKMYVAIYPDRLSEYGKQGLCVAKLAWDPQ